MSFEKLLEELDVMAKSMAAEEEEKKDDATIQAAAAESNADGDADNNGGEPDGDADDEGGEGKPMVKSFAFTLEDGQEIEAVDGTELVKSLMARIDTNEGVMAKALAQAVGLIGKQGDMIKSLQAEVKKLAGEGRGRKTVLAVTEKVTPAETLAKSELTGMTKTEFFAKANAAFDAGRISGKDLTVIDVALRSGMEIDQGLLSKVVG